MSNVLGQQYFDLIKMNTLTNTNIKESIKILFDFHDKGYSLIDIYHFMYEYIKMSNNEHKYKIIEKLCLYIQYIYEGFDNKIMLMFYTNDLIIIYNNII